MRRLFKILFFGCLVIQTSNMYAQQYVLAIGPDEIDTVTVGSRASYKVNYDPIVKSSSLIDSSLFKWIFTDSAKVCEFNTPYSILVTNAAGYIHDTAISAKMDKTPGFITLSVQEIAYPKFGLPILGSIQKLKICLVNQPIISTRKDVLSDSGTKQDSLAFGVQSIGKNGLSNDMVIPIKVVGFGPFVITYTIEQSNGTKKIFTDTLGTVNDITGSAGMSTTITIKASDLGSVTSGMAINFFVDDRFSLKSLEPVVPSGVNGSNGTIMKWYFVKQSPKPKTYHIKNK